MAMLYNILTSQSHIHFFAVHGHSYLLGENMPNVKQTLWTLQLQASDVLAGYPQYL